MLMYRNKNNKKENKGKGFIKLYRSILHNPFLIGNSKAFHLFCWCLLKANWEEKHIFIGRKKVKIKRGQFITSGEKIVDNLGIKRRTAIDWLKKLEKEDMLKVETTKNYTKISIKNYDSYQDNPQSETRQQMDIKKDLILDKEKTYVLLDPPTNAHN